MPLDLSIDMLRTIFIELKITSIQNLRATTLPIIIASLLEYLGLCERAYRLTSSQTVRNQPHTFQLLASTML